MKSPQVPFSPLGIGTLFVFAITFSLDAGSPRTDENRRLRFTSRGSSIPEGPAAAFEKSDKPVPPAPGVTEAPTGFDNLTNGFDQQGPPFDRSTRTRSCRCVPSTTTGSSSRKWRRSPTALGPTYNAQSCRECHQNVVTGGASQVAEHRTGHLTGRQFFESLGGSLIQSRATHPDIVERVAFEDDIRTFRISTNTLGDGFVEAIANSTLLAIRDSAAGRDARHGADGAGARGATADRASAASAGRASTPASSRSRPTPT